MGVRVRGRGGARATLAIALSFAAVVGCSSPSGSGDHEDDVGDDEAAIPDLLAPECDPRRADDCPAEEKCSYVVDPEFGPTNRCVALLGEGVEGESCERVGDSDDCAAHAICWGADGDGSGGSCVGFCDAGLECALDETVCSVASGGLLPLCLPRCDPLAQDCEPGWGCYPDPDDRWACDRDRSGAGGEHGDACACINCCDPGLACLAGALVDAPGCGAGEEPGADGCCGLICNLDAIADGPDEGICPTEVERCKAFYPSNASMAAFDKVGLCRL